MHFTHHHASPRDCARRLAGFEWQRRRRGFAPWAVLNKADDRLIAWGGLYEDPFDLGWGVELGYAFTPAVWGQGLATELATACLVWADTVLRFPETWAFVHLDNSASRRVLDRVGFTAVRYVPGMERLLLNRKQFGT